jgi:hypothetical protein
MGKFMRWVIDLTEYDFKILHCTGPSNVVADAFSRPLTTSTFPDAHHASLEDVCELCLKGVSFGEGVSDLVVGKATDKNTLRCPSFPQDSHIKGLARPGRTPTGKNHEHCFTTIELKFP